MNQTNLKTQFKLWRWHTQALWIIHATQEGLGMLRKAASDGCSTIGFRSRVCTRSSCNCFSAALSSDSQPLPSSAWLRNNSPLQPQQFLCTSARGHRTGTSKFYSQAWLSLIHLTWGALWVFWTQANSMQVSALCGILRGLKIYEISSKDAETLDLTTPWPQSAEGT